LKEGGEETKMNGGEFAFGVLVGATVMAYLGLFTWMWWTERARRRKEAERERKGLEDRLERIEERLLKVEVERFRRSA
jgi:hypothetical protein